MKLTKDELLIVLFSFVSCFINNIAIIAPAPFLPQENEERGYGSALTGLMLGSTPFTQIFFNMLWGSLVVKTGVHNIMKASVFILGLSMCLFGCISFIPHNASVYYLLAGFTLRGLLGVGASAVFVSAQTYITYTFPQSSVFMLSLLGAVGGLGSISGPAIGGGLYALSGFWLIFVTVGLATLSFGILMVFLLPSYDSKKSMQPRDHKCMDVSEAVSSPAQLQRSHLYARIICDRRMILGLLVTMFSAAAWHAFDPILEPELRKTYDLPKSKTSLIFLLIPTAFVIMTPIAGKIMDKLKYLDGLGMTALGFAILATAFLFAGPAPFIPIDKRLWLLLVCLTVSGLANSWIFVPPQEMTFNIKRLNLSSDEEKIAAKGFMSGCWNACYASGVCLGMVMSGSIQEVTNWSWAMMFYFVGSVGFIIIIFLVKITELKSWQNLFNLKKNAVTDQEKC